MNKTVELVKSWGDYEASHPDANIEDFCRHYLASRQPQSPPGELVGGVVPAFQAGLLLKIIGRIHKLGNNYGNLALQGTGLHQIEEHGILQTISQYPQLKKTEIIYANLLELSSGTDMLNRLKKRGLISEYDDETDKRSKRIRLTAQGEKVMEKAKQKIVLNATLLMNDLTDDDKALCIQLLKNVEIKFSMLWQKHKNKDFGEVIREMLPGATKDN